MLSAMRSAVLSAMRCAALRVQEFQRLELEDLEEAAFGKRAKSKRKRSSKWDVEGPEGDHVQARARADCAESDHVQARARADCAESAVCLVRA